MNIASIIALFSLVIPSYATTTAFMASQPVIVISQILNTTSTADEIVQSVPDNESETKPVIVQEKLLIATRKVVITAYSSTPDQTDDSPFIMANGKYVYDGAIAANFLPFGARVRIPNLFGDKIFTVNDRMHNRFRNRVDIWMPTRQDAIQFGIRTAIIEIIL